MPGTNAGTGKPLSFQCSRCRRENVTREMNREPRTGYDVTLTGRKRSCKQGTAGGRNSKYKREYTCHDCGHVGWSRHHHLEDQEKRDARN